MDSICISWTLSVSLGIYLDLTDSIRIYRSLSVYLRLYLYLSDFICISVNLSVSLVLYLYLTDFICISRTLSVSLKLYLYLSDSICVAASIEYEQLFAWSFITNFVHFCAHSLQTLCKSISWIYILISQKYILIIKKLHSTMYFS